MLRFFAYLGVHRISCCRKTAKTRPMKSRRLGLEALEDRLAPAADFGALIADPSSFDARHILVRFDPQAGDPRQLRILDGTTFASPLPLVPGLWEVQLSDGVSVATALAAYNASSHVLLATPNYTLSVFQSPNDPQFGSQWNLHNSGQSGGTPDADIDAPEAWDTTIGSAATIVAVIDTGVDYTHPDLAANIWVNAGENPGDGIDNDGNGYIDDVHGYDFVNNDGDPMDDQSHGTHVAGTIGAVGNNGIGVTGVAWNVRIMALKFLDASGSGDTADAIRALDYAVQMGALISNNSYGATGAENADPLFEEAIRNAAAFGHIFVAAAGNSGNDNDAVATYPAGFDVSNIIAVAATDENDVLASFSNYGAGSVDLAAPGTDILSTLPGGQYGLSSGTSMASPHVAGVVALVRSLHPDWTHQQVIAQVLNSVDYVPGLEGRTLTAGRLNAARAVNDTDGPRVVASDPAGGVGGVVSSLRIIFNEPIDVAGFSTDDIVSFTGPGGAIAVRGVSVVPGSLDRKFDVSFAPQAAFGSYQMVLGPDVTDRAGHIMDQDGDGTLGEIPEDRFTASFLIGEQYAFDSTDTPVAIQVLSTTSSNLNVDQDLGVADLNVRIDISALDVGFLGVALVSPAGTRVDLAPLTGGAFGPVYQNTVFDDEALTPIAGGTSPFTGSFRPSGSLSTFDNQSTLGTWRLEVLSLVGGTINSWSLFVIANPPRMTISDVAIPEGDTGVTQATFTVSLSNATGEPISVDFTSADGTAFAGSDYGFSAGTLTFAPGETAQTITVPVLGDTLDEGDETFFVNLSNAVNAALLDAQGIGTIRNDEVIVSIGDVSVMEGNSGNANAVFTVSLSMASINSVIVQYATAAGTAAAGADYTTAGGTLTFAPGESTKPVTIIVKGDTRHERAETFFVNLTASGALVGDSQAVGTILNDDPVPVMSIADASVSEGDSGTRNLSFTVSLTVPSDDPVTVNYATANDTADAGSDYVAVSGTLTFSPGQTSRTVTVVVNGDTLIEPSETLCVNLSQPANALLMDSQGAGAILTDDLGLTISDVSVLEGNDGAFTAVFTINLSIAVPFEVWVNYATANSTAASATDFVAASGALVFAAGQTVETISVVGIADARNELDEAFFVNLSGAVNAAIVDSQGRCTILDDDPLPTISIGDAAVAEGNSATKTLTFTATLSAPSGQTVTVQYATADGSASSGSDYAASGGTLTFVSGVTSRTFNITINGDATAELDETFTINLGGAVNAVLADGQAVGTIQDDDSFTVDDVTLIEGDAGTALAVFTVHLLAPRPDVVSVSYATANGTATSGADYLAVAGTLTFQPGETAQTVPVTVIGDRYHEADETIFLNLTAAVGAGIGDNKGVATIVNDDATPSLSVADVFITEGNTGTKNASFALRLSGASGQSVSVQYATASGSALSGTDFQPRSGTASISAGNTSTTVTVPINGDSSAEGNEIFYLNLSGPTNVLLANAQAAATIFDDDPLPAVSIGDVTTTEGNSGAKLFSFVVSLSVASSQTVTVQAGTSDGTAAAGSDYIAKSELVTFTAGQTSKTVTITVNGDLAIEPTETFQVVLSAPTNAVVGDGQGVGTIQNDDSSLSVSDVTVSEGNDGTTIALFTLSLTGAQQADSVTVNYATANSTASAGTDYISTSGLVSFAAGETTQTVAVFVVGDTTNENNETLYLNLTGAVNATIADSRGVATIVDASDPVPSLTIDDASVTEGASGTKNLTFTARLSAVSGKTVTATYATANGAATAGSDYTAKSGTLSFSAGITSVSVSIVVAGDAVAETDETFFLNLSSPVNATLADAQGIGTITDDDSLVVDDVAVAEGDAGSTFARFTVRLLAPRTFPVSVDYATANAGATVGVDYLAAAGTLVFAPGDMAKTVDVAIVGDRLDEINEAFNLNLSKATGTLIADSQGIATITDDDQPPTILISDVLVVAEGNSGTKTITFTVRLSEPSGQNVTVQYATADGTAVAGSDYVAKSGTLTFSPGATTATVTITVNGDMDIEGNESFYLNLSNPLNASLGTWQGIATILDDDN